MYSSKIIDAMDPDQLVASIRPIGSDLTVLERGPFTARSVLFNLGQVYAQRGQERLARVKHVETLRGGILFLSEPGPSMFMDGAEIGIDQIAVASPGVSYTSRLSGRASWGAITLAKEDMDALCAPESGFCRSRMSGTAVFTPAPAVLRRLRSLHGRIGRLAVTTPELLTNPASAHEFEHGLIEAMSEALSQQVLCFDTAAKRNHRRIVNRFREILEVQAEQPFLINAISQAIGASDRTLRLACQEQLGISPGQYAMLRRMRSARRALRKADPETTRVTDIATEHGFWEFGRFSVRYRQVFGESPSATLRAAA